MINLLYMNLVRLIKSKFFWLCALIMAVFGTYLPIYHYLSNKRHAGTWTLERDFFLYAMILLFATTILTALFVGADYSNGTIRNKVTIGHARYAIYFSNLLVMIVANIAWCVFYMIPAFAVGVPLIGWFTCDISTILLYMLAVLVMSIAVTSLMLMISMICSNRTYSAVICLLTAMFLFAGGFFLEMSLAEPEFYVSTGGDIQIENGKYLSGTTRTVAETFYDIFPGGQALQLSSPDPDCNILGMLIYNSILFAVTTVLGIVIFRKKDLK